MVVEAFNKVQLEYARRESKKGESSTQDITDIQKLLTTVSIIGNHKDIYFESKSIPDNFLTFKRVSFNGRIKECESSRRFTTYLGEEANVDDLLRDPNKNPNFEWAETFLTFIDNKIRIYTDKKFNVEDPILTYYRKPLPIKIGGIIDLSTQDVSYTEQECEFRDDLVELLIDEACVILSGDIESINNAQRESQNIQRSE
jgi:hypothetical protein